MNAVAASLVAIVAVQLTGADGALANTFGLPTNYAVGGGARAIVARDFDGDGDLDLATANQNAGTVSVLRNTGNGAYVPAGTYTLSAGLVGIVAGRFNAGTDADLAVTNSYTGQVRVLHGAGGVSFTPGPTYALGASVSPRLLAVGRFNADALDDVAVANGNSNTVTVLRGTGPALVVSGTFTVVAGGTFQPHGIAVGDFNHDSKADLATANFAPSGPTVSILPGNGAGAFGPPQVLAMGPFPMDISARNINGDSYPDLVVSNFTTAGTVTARLGNASGSFGPPITSTVPTANPQDKPSALAVAQFGHSAALDLAVAMGGPAGNRVVVMCGNNTGAFTICHLAGGHRRKVGNFPFGLAAGKLNNGGKIDIASANLNSGTASVILSP